MPARGGAGTWLLAESRAREKLADVLEERAVALGALGLDEFAWLPFEQQKKLQQRFHQRWLASGAWQALQSEGLADDQLHGRLPPHVGELLSQVAA